MTRLTLTTFRTFPVVLALVVGTCGWPDIAFAQSIPPATTTRSAPPAAADTDTISLTDEQRDAILDANFEARNAATRGELEESESLGRGVHGEVGMMIGSHGARGMYGAADIPLGNDAEATISFEAATSRSGVRVRFRGDC
jgi:hypothetical protein